MSRAYINTFWMFISGNRCCAWKWLWLLYMSGEREANYTKKWKNKRCTRRNEKDQEISTKGLICLPWLKQKDTIDIEHTHFCTWYPFIYLSLHVSFTNQLLDTLMKIFYFFILATYRYIKLYLSIYKQTRTQMPLSHHMSSNKAKQIVLLR